MATRMNISVPDDLKRRMDKVKVPVNWSATACEAFELKLGDLAATKGTKTMSDVVERLRASKLSHASEQEKQGRADGREWAEHHAEAHELESLSRSRAECGNDWDRVFGLEGGKFCTGAFLYSLMHPTEDYALTNEEAENFWESMGQECNDVDADYAYGFAEGALELWGEVAGQV